MALSAPRNTPVVGTIFQSPVATGVAGSQTLYAGAMISRTTQGYLAPAADRAGDVVQGRMFGSGDGTRIDGTVVNAAAAGNQSATTDRGIFQWGNQANALVVATDAICYVHDDATVCNAAGSAQGIVAGLVVAVDANGVWVNQSVAGLAAAQYLTGPQGPQGAKGPQGSQGV